jgi:hypothetical protein
MPAQKPVVSRGLCPVIFFAALCLLCVFDQLLHLLVLSPAPEKTLHSCSRRGSSLAQQSL